MLVPSHRKPDKNKIPNNMAIYSCLFTSRLKDAHMYSECIIAMNAMFLRLNSGTRWMNTTRSRSNILSGNVHHPRTIRTIEHITNYPYALMQESPETKTAWEFFKALLSPRISSGPSPPADRCRCRAPLGRLARVDGRTWAKSDQLRRLHPAAA